MFNPMRMPELWGVYLAILLVLLAIMSIGITLVIRLLRAPDDAEPSLYDRPYSHLLPLLAADVLSPGIRRLYVKSLLVDATFEDRQGQRGPEHSCSKAMRECRRLLAELQAQGLEPDTDHEIPHRDRIDALLDQALEGARHEGAPGDPLWSDLHKAFRELRGNG